MEVTSRAKINKISSVRRHRILPRILWKLLFICEISAIRGSGSMHILPAIHIEIRSGRKFRIDDAVNHMHDIFKFT